MVLRLKVALVPARKMPIWSRNCPFIVSLQGNENGDPPFYWFLLVMAKRKIYLKEKKNLVSRSCIFFYKNDVKCRIWRQYKRFMF